MLLEQTHVSGKAVKTPDSSTSFEQCVWSLHETFGENPLNSQRLHFKTVKLGNLGFRGQYFHLPTSCYRQHST